MYINEFTYLLEESIIAFLQSQNRSIIKILNDDNNYYYINIILIKEVSFNPESLNNSHEEAVLLKIELHIKELLKCKDIKKFPYWEIYY